MRCFLRLLGEQGTRGPSGRLAWLALACPGVLGAPARTQAVAAFLLAGARGGSLASVRVGGQVTVQKERPQGPCTSGVAARWSVPFARRGGGGGFAIFDEVLIFVKNLTNYLFYHFFGTIAELPYRF